MKAIVYHKYGPPEVLQLEELEKPTPKDNEILIRINATSVGYGDIIARNFKNIPLSKFHMPMPFYLGARLYFGIRKPKITILGSEFAGVAEAVGKDVSRFKKGDQVYGYIGQSMGANAEYLSIPEDICVAPKPASMTFEEAAAVPYGAIMALSLLRKVNIQPGQKVLINGASGGIGSAAVQLAKNHFGAEVTGVCSTPRVDYVKALGADMVIDYTKDDFTQNDETYDLVLDILGKSPFSRVKGVLNQNGIHLFASFKMKQLFQMLWTKMIGSKKVICAMATDKAEDLMFITELIEAGKIKSIIDKCYPLDKAAEAHSYVENGRAQGKVVITVANSSEN
ncbi:NAD(P)-dependent alcohol dehydrogenase [Candidatus Neomarinimicrobiota bacterium]